MVTSESVVGWYGALEVNYQCLTLLWHIYIYMYVNWVFIGTGNDLLLGYLQPITREMINCQLYHSEQILVIVEWIYKTFLQRKCMWICDLPKYGQFHKVPMFPITSQKYWNVDTNNFTYHLLTKYFKITDKKITRVFKHQYVHCCLAIVPVVQCVLQMYSGHLYDFPDGVPLRATTKIYIRIP